MKTILTVFAVVILAGCSTIFPPNYDNNEYYIFARLETHSRFLRNECSDAELVKARLDKMLFDAELLNSYSFFLPRNSEIFEVSKILATDVREMLQRYQGEKPPSVTYCKIKSKAFTTKSRKALETVGNLQGVE